MFLGAPKLEMPFHHLWRSLMAFALGKALHMTSELLDGDPSQLKKYVTSQEEQIAFSF